MEEVYHYTRSPAWEELVGKSLLKKKQKRLYIYICCCFFRLNIANANQTINKYVMLLQLIKKNKTTTTKHMLVHLSV